jgi:hypothetical protein
MTGQDPAGAIRIDTAKPHPARMYDWYRRPSPRACR